jgi:transposase
MGSRRDRPVYRKGRGLASVQPSFPLDSIEELLEGEPLVLALYGLVEEELGDELRSSPPLSGGYSYDPVALFAVWMFALMDGVRSSRKLEKCCRHDDRYRYLSRSCRPDHTTLSRFRKGLGENLDLLFARVSHRAASLGRLTHGPAAVDGTRIPANRSAWRRMVSGVEDDVEPEAAQMASQGRILVGYNLQAAVEVGSDFVTGFALESSCHDMYAMEGMLEAVGRQSGSLPEAVVADKGYDSLPNAYALDSRGVTGYLPKAKKQPAAFVPGEDGVFRCLAGHVPSERLWVSKEGVHYRCLRVYRCTNCPLRKPCGATSKVREMRVRQGASAGDRRAANLRAETEEGQRLLRARGPTVERLFAHLKQVQGLRRFLLKGRSGARLEFGLHCLAYNLRKLLRPFWTFFSVSSRLESEKRRLITTLAAA